MTSWQGLHALILAAGGSTRFGSEKALARYGGQTLLQRVVAQALEVCPDQVSVVLGASHERVAPAAAPATIVLNRHWRSGLASSLQAGVEALPDDCDAVLVMLCDQPAIRTAQYVELAQAWREQPRKVIAAAYAGTKGVPAILPRRLFAALRDLSGDSGARLVIAQEGPAAVEIPMPEAAMDVDRPSDMPT